MREQAHNNQAALVPGRPWYLWAAVVFSGSAVMSFELLGARLLMPTFGMGVEVWAAVIATTLGSLAVGYWAGGRLADALPFISLLGWTFLLAAVSVLTVYFFGQRLMSLCTRLPFVVAAWCSAATLMVVPLALLGMVQPIVARLMLDSTVRTGRTVGGLLAAGTIGGVAGTVSTALILIPRYGLSRTLMMLVCGSAVMAIIVWIAGRHLKLAVGVILFLLISARSAWPPEFKPCAEGRLTVLDRVDGFYGQLEVVEYPSGRALLCDGVIQGALPHTASLGKGSLIGGCDYIELIPYLRPEARSALLIGLGAGLHEQALAAYGIQTHAVEIEPAVAELATKHFGLAADVTIADGRAFLACDRRQFGAIILDIFQGGSIPEHLYTQEAFKQMGSHLTRDGVLAVHFISRPRHIAVRAVGRTLQSVFPYVAVACSGIADELQHVYLFASCDSLELAFEQLVELNRLGFPAEGLRRLDGADAFVLVDDRPCLAWLSRDLVAEHRQRSLELRRQLSW